MTIAAKWLHFEIGKFYNFRNIRRNVCVNRLLMNKVWCKWQAANFSCLLSNTKESGKEKLTSSGLWMMSSEVNNESTKLNSLGFPKEISIRIGFYQSRYYRNYYLTTAKNYNPENTYFWCTWIAYLTVLVTRTNIPLTYSAKPGKKNNYKCTSPLFAHKAI